MKAHGLSEVGLGIVILLINPGLPLFVRAQSIFSLNTVGYVDVNLAAGTNLIANPLNAARNTISNLFSPAPDNGVTDGSYFVSLDANSPTYGITNRYSSATGWDDPNDVLLPPNAAILWLTSAQKITFIGEPWRINGTGPSCLSYPIGFSFSGWFPEEICGCVEPPCASPLPEGTTISKWNTVSQGYDDYVFFELGGTPQWLPSMPEIGLGEGFRMLAPQSFSARSPFQPTLGGSPLRHGRPFELLRNVHRDGTNLTFRFAATNGTLYSLLWTTNILSGVWRVEPRGLGGDGNGFATNTVAMTNRSAFFKIHPVYTGLNPILVPRVTGRGTSSFSFDFYAPVSTNYFVDRLFDVDWTNIGTVVAASGTLVTVTDSNALASTAYYRMRY